VKRKELKPGAEETHRLLGDYINEVARLAEWADRGGLVDSTTGSGSGNSTS
jgi:hypothetical protein